jgi:hypothetical protein
MFGNMAPLRGCFTFQLLVDCSAEPQGIPWGSFFSAQHRHRGQVTKPMMDKADHITWAADTEMGHRRRAQSRQVSSGDAGLWFVRVSSWIQKYPSEQSILAHKHFRGKLLL